MVGGVAGGDPGERDTLTLRKLRTLEACDDLALWEPERLLPAALLGFGLHTPLQLPLPW